MSIATKCELCKQEGLSVLVGSKHVCDNCLSNFQQKIVDSHRKYEDNSPETYLDDVCPSLKEDYKKACKIALELFSTDKFVFKLDHDGRPQFNLPIYVYSIPGIDDVEDNVDFIIEQRDKFVNRTIEEDMSTKLLMMINLDICWSQQ